MKIFRIICLVVLFGSPALAERAPKIEGTLVFQSERSFNDTLSRLKTAIAAHKMGLVAEACADCGARNFGVKIAGNRVVMIYHPRFAIRMLAASIEAGVEAPLRIYVTEQKHGTQLSYRLPSAVFAPYGVDDLDAMAQDLDAILAAIMADTLNEK
ncbi:MAG: DUF302 domain-containing protein [Magnetovibrio sp.]|nr:DUF302 domain-containing protein [Magnetovibrio sp.]